MNRVRKYHVRLVDPFGQPVFETLYYGGELDDAVADFYGPFEPDGSGVDHRSAAVVFSGQDERMAFRLEVTRQ